MRGDFFERYVRVEHFKALSRWKTPPDEKGATLFCRTIFENFVFFQFWGLCPPQQGGYFAKGVFDSDIH